MSNRLNEMISSMERLKAMKVNRYSVARFVGWMELYTSSYFPERKPLQNAIARFDNGKLYDLKKTMERDEAMEVYYKGKSLELRKDVQYAKSEIRRLLRTLRHIQKTP